MICHVPRDVPEHNHSLETEGLFSLGGGLLYKKVGDACQKN